MDWGGVSSVLYKRHISVALEYISDRLRLGTMEGPSPIPMVVYSPLELAHYFVPRLAPYFGRAAGLGIPVLLYFQLASLTLIGFPWTGCGNVPPNHNPLTIMTIH